MRLSGQQFQFFYEQILSVKKAPRRKASDSPPLSCFCWGIIIDFVVFGLLNFILLVGFGLVYVFVRLKSFRKKISWLEIVLTSYTILLTCTPINPPVKNLFVLYALIFNCVNL